MFQISLEAARVNAGFTRKQAAQQLGIHVTTLYNWEKGKTFPDVDSFLALCRLYQCPEDIIFFVRQFA